MGELLTLFLSTVLINNIILSQFLGMCPFMGVSKNRSSALGMGFAVLFVIVGSSIITYFLYHGVLVTFGLEYLQLITFILVIACFVQFTELFLKKFSPSLYKSLGIFLPLITTNCAVLAVALENITKKYTIVETLVNSVGVSVGFMLVLYIFSTIRERLDMNTKTPKAFLGNPLALITAGLMALAFGGLAGLI
ncbi:MAG: RnfABCDGE type electron transport complex subunit A [Erysipelotrichaceae bacterium]|nr:RnfABCDGE type electron transport complex subunit A [Erysipelotrichaceae bacterium]